MPTANLTDVAHAMIRRHGLRAGAVALERAAETRIGGGTAEHERWQAVHTLICELKRTGRGVEPAMRDRVPPA